MEIDANEYRDFLNEMLRVLKEAKTHLTAYRAFFEQVSNRVPELAFVLRKAFEGAREEMDAKYRPMLESISAESSPESVNRILKEFLAQWKPKGPVN